MTNKRGYFADLWNVMDWANYVLYFLTWARMQELAEAIEAQESQAHCTSYMCTAMGYFDDWKVMGIFRQMKVFLSLCVCIQLFKILKFLAQVCSRTETSSSSTCNCALPRRQLNRALLVCALLSPSSVR